MAESLLSGERIDDLQFKGLRVIQNPSLFCFGTDAVLLSSFANVRKGQTVIDLGTGCGVIALLLAGRTEARKIIGIEIQKAVADMAIRSVALNGCQERIEIMNMDLKDAPKALGCGCADAIVCNPPYGKHNGGLHSAADAQRIARHEVACTLEDCILAAEKLLKNGGRAAFIHQSDRFMELLNLLQKHHLEPKRIRMIQPRMDRAPNLMLVEGVKQGKSGVVWLPPIIIRGENGEYTQELLRMYHKQDSPSINAPQ